MIITALAQADRPRWTELWGAYLDFYETTLPPTVYGHTWSRLMQDTDLHGLAARDGATLLGITHFLYHPNAWTLTPVCYLQDLFVDPAARGQGVGTALIEAVATHARTRHAARLYWFTQDHNTAARSLYDRIAKHAGFIRYDYPPLTTPAPAPPPPAPSQSIPAADTLR